MAGMGGLPGDRARRAELARMIRVDHAGEYGAKRIYQGQLAVLGRGRQGDKVVDLIRHMQAQEQVHLDTFAAMIAQRRVRPTALLGERAAMACTVAVEEAIDEHYAAQAASLGEDEAELRGVIERFREEELEHRDIGLAHEAEQAPAYRLLSAAIKAGCRVAIAASERV